MHSRRLVRHFLSQFVEPDLSSDLDSHQTLALVAAGVVTIPLFATVFMSVRYLTRPLQSAGWTGTTAIEDQITFCATSLLVSAIVTTIEWDALALNPRDATILGVLPISHRDIVQAKVAALLIFVAAFVVALNALPAVLHPPLMVANLPLALPMVFPLMAAQALSTSLAAVMGCASVVGLRESLYLSFGPRAFLRISGVVRSGLLLVLLVLVTLVPLRLSGPADWMFQPSQPPVLLRPVAWFAATHAAIAGRVLQRLPERKMPPAMLAEEQRLRTRYESNLPHLTALALEGAAALLILVTAALTMYVWNARRLHVLPETGTTPVLGISRICERVARAIVRPPATRAGLLFMARTLVGNPLHRLYLIVSLAIGVTLVIGLAPDPTSPDAPPLRTMHLAAQTLMLTALGAGFRAAIRTSADERAGWLFGIAETGHLREFRHGVRLAAIAAVVATVLLLLPLHAAAWGLATAAAHAFYGIALGWLLVETASASIELPLVVTIPSNDGLNTVGAVLLGATVIAVFVLARLERAALTDLVSGVVFALAIVLAAMGIRYASERSRHAMALHSLRQGVTSDERAS